MRGTVVPQARQADTPAGGGDLDRMRVAVAELERVMQTLKDDLIDRDEDLDELRAEVEEQKTEIRELENALADAENGMDELAEHTDTLARLHTKIRKGQIADGLYDLDRVLSHLDSAWGTRA